jgi:SRSO17 transposase
MNHRQTDDSESRFAGYVEGLASVIGHKDREGPLRDYCTGLLMPCERKSVEPMAAITAPHRTAAQHQSLLHFIGEGKWSDEKVLAKVREMVVPQMQRYGAIEAWIIDDTGFPSRVSIQWAWRGNIAGSLASRTIARSQYRCRWPIIMRACRWPISFICRKTGLKIASAGAKWGFPKW